MATRKTKVDLTIVDDLLGRVRKEREDNIAKWGVQTHQSYRGEGARRQYERAMNQYKQIWDAQNAANERTWDTIILEEVFEALSETDPENRIYELVQTAAMALAEAESIILRKGRLLDTSVCPLTGKPCEQTCATGCEAAEEAAEAA